MSGRWGAAILVTAALGGCAAGSISGPAPLPPPGPAPGFDPAATPRHDPSVDRVVDRAFLEGPFANGALTLMARDGNEFETWRLVPCRGGQAICAGSLDGPAGTLTVTPDWHVVTGLGPGSGGAIFWLDEGGHGLIERGGRFQPLAWDAEANGTGPGTDAALESAADHCADLDCTDIPRPY